MLAVDAGTARAFVGDGNRIHVLDTATGRLLRTVKAQILFVGLLQTVYADVRQMWGRID